MSWTELLASVRSCSEGDSDRPPLDWLLAMLKQAMEEAMASEAKPLQKANAIARLGNLYLKAYGAAELARENKALKQRAAALEEELQQVGESAEAPAAPVAQRSARTAGGARPSESVAALASSPPEHGKAPAPHSAKSHLALPIDHTLGKKSSAGGRPPKSGRRAGPRRP
jgi:hypothetical protein